MSILLKKTLHPRFLTGCLHLWIPFLIKKYFLTICFHLTKLIFNVTLYPNGKSRQNLKPEHYLKRPVFEVFLVRIFLRLSRMRKDTLYQFLFILNARKYGPEKLRIETLFTHWKRNNNARMKIPVKDFVCKWKKNKKQKKTEAVAHRYSSK